jgi:hypothetical protein
LPQVQDIRFTRADHDLVDALFGEAGYLNVEFEQIKPSVTAWLSWLYTQTRAKYHTAWGRANSRIGLELANLNERYQSK